MPHIAIVVCTYNPLPALFRRVLDAIASLEIPAGCEVECCLIDNNSHPPLRALDYVQDFLLRTPWARLVVETTQGLSAARRAGVEATSAPVIVFLDDDNQPGTDYLVHLLHLLRLYPQVGVWGPGRVEVEFTEEVNPWVKSRKWLFQERNSQVVSVGNEPRWTAHHPAGTGQVVYRTVLQNYLQLVDRKAVSLTGRMGTQLTSGEDAQIVYTAIRQGYHVGVAPSLALRHLIPRQRTRITYLKKLRYNIFLSGAVAHSELFPDQRQFYYETIRSPFQILVGLLRIVGGSLRTRSLAHFQLSSGTYLGQLAGSYAVVEGKLPGWLVLAVRLLNLQ